VRQSYKQSATKWFPCLVLCVRQVEKLILAEIFDVESAYLQGFVQTGALAIISKWNPSGLEGQQVLTCQTLRAVEVDTCCSDRHRCIVSTSPPGWGAAGPCIAAHRSAPSWSLDTPPGG